MVTSLYPGGEHRLARRLRQRQARAEKLRELEDGALHNNILYNTIKNTNNSYNVIRIYPYTNRLTYCTIHQYIRMYDYTNRLYNSDSNNDNNNNNNNSNNNNDNTNDDNNNNNNNNEY